MTIVYTDAHQVHQPSHEINDGKPVAYPETAARAEAILSALKEQKVHEIIAPKEFLKDHIYATHSHHYVDFLERQAQALSGEELFYPSYFITDTYAPITAGTYQASRAAVDAVLTGADKILSGESAIYALCRPPGHHAEHHSMGGYCYFNNAAIAGQYLSAHGRVAILDIDFHHGNGTQASFYDRDDVLYVSLHADPRDSYPYISGFVDEQGHGKGKGYNLNYPLPLSTDDDQYLETLGKALEDISGFKPDYLIVSAGFDTFHKDPVGGLKLTMPVYSAIGQSIAGLNLPTLIVQEGGYNIDYLGDIAVNLLSGFETKA